jgi:hypothetical protein
MKACLLGIFLFAFHSMGYAQQGVVKLYGFKQPVVKGVPSTYETDEQGNKVEPKDKLHTNVFIFLSYPPGVIITPVEFWMDGLLYSIKQEPVQTPVEIIYENGLHEAEKIILVPQTADTVIRILLTEKLPFKTPAIKKSSADTNELVIVYKMNGKLFTQSLKKIKGLRMDAMK